MKTEDDRTIEEQGKRSHEVGFDAEEAPMTTEAEAEPENSNGPGHDAPLPSEPDLILDERLTSAAAPFLYMLSLALIAVAGYFVYLFIHG
jgi:hypothetical protein